MATPTAPDLSPFDVDRLLGEAASETARYEAKAETLEAGIFKAMGRRRKFGTIYGSPERTAEALFHYVRMLEKARRRQQRKAQFATRELHFSRRREERLTRFVTKVAGSQTLLAAEAQALVDPARRPLAPEPHGLEQVADALVALGAYGYAIEVRKAAEWVVASQEAAER